MIYYSTGYYNDLQDDAFVLCNADNINWNASVVYIYLSENSLRTFHDRINWSIIIRLRKKLSKEFIIDFVDKFNIRQLLDRYPPILDDETKEYLQLLLN